jgi:hypothetical protein
MIIETPDGAVLEVFWRVRGEQPWSQTTALHFLSRYRLDREGLKGLRFLLSERSEVGRTWRAQDPVLLQRAAWLISTESVLVAEFGNTQRWPGSGFVLGSSWDSSLLFWRDQLHLIRDMSRVREWLKEMQAPILRAAAQKNSKGKEPPNKADQEAIEGNKKHIVALRKLIASAPGVPDFNNVGDADFLQLVDGYFESNDLLPIYHRYPGIAEPGPDDPDNPPDGPPGPKPPNDDDDPDDPGPFIPGVCLFRAAETGTPFVTIPKNNGSGELT